MSEPIIAGVRAASSMHRSPFEGHAPGTQASSAGRIGVRLRPETLPGLLVIATWPAAIAALERALGQALGLSVVPARTGLTMPVPQGLLMRSGPFEFMLVGAGDLLAPGQLRAHVGSDIGSVTDLGHARCRIHVSGEQCRATLYKLFALDLRTAAYPVGELRMTGHHHVPCMLHRLGADAFDLYVFTTYAFDQLETLLDAAREYGVALESGSGIAG